MPEQIEKIIFIIVTQLIVIIIDVFKNSKDEKHVWPERDLKIHSWHHFSKEV